MRWPRQPVLLLRIGILLIGCTAVVAPTDGTTADVTDETQTGTLWVPTPEEVSTATTGVSNADMQAQADANNRFGFDLLHTLQEQQHDPSPEQTGMNIFSHLFR